MTPWQAVFFDFDGVVLDSVPIKTEAFAEMYRPYGAEVEAAVVAHHLAHGGVSRFEKFRHYHQVHLGQELTPEELQVLCRDFETRVLQRVLEAPFIPGAEEGLRELQDTGVPAFVVSGTPEAEVRHIVQARGLAPRFREVHGSPRRKPEILEDILSRWGFRPERCLFLGDATTDFEAAAAHGLRFLGIVPEGEPSPFPPGTPTGMAVRFNLG